MRGPESWLKAIPALPLVAARHASLARGKAVFDYLTEDRTQLYPAVAFEEIAADLLRLAPGQGGRPLSEFERLLAADVEEILLVRVPQFPSSRAWGDWPVESSGEYAARVPKDPAQHQIIPVPPRPFPAELRDPRSPGEPPLRSDYAVAGLGAGDCCADCCSSCAGSWHNPAVLAYIVRRLLYAIPILIGVNLLTFALFFVVNTPDDMARMQLGVKRVTPEAIEKWKVERGYDKPLLCQCGRLPGWRRVTDTIFFQKSVRMFAFDFGRADDGRDIAREIGTPHGADAGDRVADLRRSACSSTVTFALLLAFFRATASRFLGRRAVRGDDVDFRPVLHHRRPVPGQQGVAPGADLRLRRRAGRVGVSWSCRW